MARQAPGGKSSICFGSEDTTATPAGSRQNLNSSNNFASKSDPNAGNFVTDRSSTRIRQAPGGNSNVCFGTDTAAERFPAPQKISKEEPKPETSNNQAFAERVVRVPGGKSSICLGSDAPAEQPSTNASTRGAPGGKSTICFGTDASAERFPAQKTEDQVFAERVICAPGGNANIFLGGDSPTRLSTARGAQKEVLTETPGTGGYGGQRQVAAGKGRVTPGGQSSIQFGQEAQTAEDAEDPEEEFLKTIGQENLEAKENSLPNVPQMPLAGKKLLEKESFPEPPKKLNEQYEQRTTTRAPPGGRSNVIFG